MFIVYRVGSGPSLDGKRFHTFNEAKNWADKSRSETGRHYGVIKIEGVYTTQTLYELLEENAQ